jgi:pimeloyl-ACP methyl ester carboxylesterase
MPLYLLHGALGSAGQLAPLLDALAAVGVAAKTIELPGHGGTPLGEREFSIGTFAGQVEQRLDADGVECTDIFGYSMGGYVALAMALAHPERVRRVLTLGTKFEWTPEVAAREVARLDPARMRAKVPHFVDQLTERHAGAGGWEATVSSTASFLSRLGENPLLNSAQLGRISIPVCVGVGDRDATVTIDESLRASRQLGSGSLAVLPGTQHPLEQLDLSLLAAVMRKVFSS